MAKFKILIICIIQAHNPVIFLPKRHNICNKLLNKHSQHLNAMPIIALQQLYQNTPIDQLSDTQILTALQMWDTSGRFFDIIALVDSLKPEQRTPAILTEQACACNNVYWENPTKENEAYLKRAIRILSELDGADVDTKAWHYNLGYAYFYLGDVANARTHLTASNNHKDEDELLDYLEQSERHHATPQEIMTGGVGGIEFLLKDFVALLETHAPKVLEGLHDPATDDDIHAFEQALGISLPDNVKQFYRTFNGQKIGAYFADTDAFHHFLSLEDALFTQESYGKKLQARFGESWQTLTLSHPHFDERIKNRLYHRHWLPLCIKDNEYDDTVCLTCIDLDPNTDGQIGQIITVMYDENLADYEIYWDYPDLNALIDELRQMLDSGFLYYDESVKCLTADYAKDISTPENLHYHAIDNSAYNYYVRRVFGKISKVIEHSDPLAPEICLIEPDSERPFYTLITRGMGSCAMTTPDIITPRHAELLIRLPLDWQADSTDERYLWSLQYLSLLARYPIDKSSYIASGHVIPTPTLTGSQFNSLLLIEADDGDDVAILKLPTGKNVVFYTLVPLYKEEMHYRLEQGNIALMQALENANIPYPPVVDVNRPNACAKYHSPHDTDLSLFDRIFWSFNSQYYEDLDNFYEAVIAYNNGLNNDLSDADLFATLFDEPTLYIMYQAIVKDISELGDYEHLNNPEALTDKPSAQDITLHISALDGMAITALELLWRLHNALTLKTLGEMVFFEGFEKIGKVYNDGEDLTVLEAKIGN